MKKLVKIVLVSVISLFLISSVAYASFLITEIYNEDANTIDNTYDIVFHYIDSDNTLEETSRKIEDIEEDSYFELPYLNYESLFFDGWSLNANKQNALKEQEISVKDLKTKYAIDVTNKTIDLYAVVNDIQKGMVLITVTDETTDSLKYFMKVEASTSFSLFNISYAYPSTFVDIKVGDEQTTYTVNDRIDLSPYSGGKLSIVVSNQT